VDESKAKLQPFNAALQMARAMALRWPRPLSPERREKQGQRLAALKEDAERQLAESLKRILDQLPPHDARLHAGMAQILRWDSTTQLRAAVALFVTKGVPPKARLEVLVIQLSPDATERLNAAITLAQRFNRGRQKDEERWIRAKRAYLEAHRRGKPQRAVPDAMAAGQLKKSAIYERAKLEKWLAQAKPGNGGRD
jgi:hypothetical protein